MKQRTRYYFHSPRGFANEADVYAVPEEHADRWLKVLERRLGSKALYAATAVVPITRKRAAQLIRRDGVGLQICEEDYNYEDCTTRKLTPASVKSARRAAMESIKIWEESMAMDSEYSQHYGEIQ